jgi:hypothetical protein
MRIVILIVALLLLNCKSNKKLEVVAINDWKDHWEDPRTRDSLLADERIHKRIKECLIDTSIVVLTRDFLVDSSRFSEIRNIGDINGDHVNDSIMIIPELYITPDSSYESGTAIVFTDPTIPRIKVDQACLAVNFIFVVGDIDEDSILELGKYYTTCVSRYKRIELFSLKKDIWKSYGAVTYDVWFEDPPKEERIRKTAKNRFEMREVTDSANVRIDRWIEFEVN